MPAAEVMEWAAFERVYGPLLVQERVDLGFAHLAFILASLLGKSRRKLKIEDFLPAWYQHEERSDDAVKRKFEQMLRSALADDQHPGS